MNIASFVVERAKETPDSPAVSYPQRRGRDGTTLSKIRRAPLAAESQPVADTRNIRQLLFHPKFPVDARHTAKIGREKLAHWASQQLKRLAGGNAQT